MHAKEGGGVEVECVGRQERYFTRWVIYVREVQHWCLGAFENRWSCSSVCSSGVATDYVGVNVCINSVLIVYYHFSECVLLLRLLHPSIYRWGIIRSSE